MKSGNDRFPHGGISIVLSSVTRFDTLKINSPAERTDSATTEDKDEEKGKREEKKGLTSIRSSSIHRSFLFFFSFFLFSFYL